MIISIGCDHGGFNLKQDVVNYLLDEGYTVLDRGCDSSESVHYPIYANLVCEDLQKGACEYGILICTTGFGMCMCANKHKGIRSATVRCVDEAYLTRSHNDCNVLCLGAKYTGLEEAKEIIKTFLNTPFAGGRHQIRVDMIKKVEEK